MAQGSDGASHSVGLASQYVLQYGVKVTGKS